MDHPPGDHPLRRRVPLPGGLSRKQLAFGSQLGDIVAVLGEADPADRAEVYGQIGLRLTYHPQEQKIRVQARPDADPYGKLVGVRGSTRTIFQPRSLLWADLIVA
jgi:site-specific DNA recombinase